MCAVSLRELISSSELLEEDFYGRRTVDVARDCLGKILIHGSTAGRIVEVEAYLGLDDLAAHASKGLTERTRVLFGPPGHAYVYLSYGVHECLNFVAEPNGTPGCVLIRAVEPLAGAALMMRRRGNPSRFERVGAGPGNLTRAMGITRKLNGSSLITGPLTVRRFRDEPAFEVRVTPRIGITQCADWPLRFVVASTPFASR